MTSVRPSIDQHPDILALREPYERAAQSTFVQTTFGLAFLTALYAAISPWVIGFDATTRLTANNLIVGLAAAVAVLGFGAAFDRVHGMTWALPLMGIWLIVSPWILRGMAPTAGMIWSNVLAGALLTLFGGVAAYYGMTARSVHTR